MTEQTQIEIIVSLQLKDGMMKAAIEAGKKGEDTGKAAVKHLRRSPKVKPLLEFMGDADKSSVVVLEADKKTAKILVSKVDVSVTTEFKTEPEITDKLLPEQPASPEQTEQVKTETDNKPKEKKLKDLLPKISNDKAEAMPGQSEMSAESADTTGKLKEASSLVPKNKDEPTLTKSKEVSGDANETISFLTVIAKNFGSVPWMARDLNVARQNTIKTVKAMGGKGTNKADAMFLKESELEAKLDSEQERLKSKSPEQVKEGDKKKGIKVDGFLKKAFKGTKVGKMADKLMGGFKNIFSPKNFMKILGKIALPLLIITTLFQGFMAGWNAWKETGSIWEAFKATIGGMVEFITFGFIDKDMVSNMYDWAFDAIAGVMQSVANFFNFGDFFAEKLGKVKEFLGVGVKAKPMKPAPEQKLAPEQKSEVKTKKGEIGGEVTVGQVEPKKKEVPVAKPSPAPTPVGKVATKKGEIGGTITTGGAAPPPSPSTAPTKEGKAPAVGADDKWIMDMVKKHEGVRTKPYKDSVGLWTIGVGHLIGDGKSLPPEWNREFSMAEIDALFAEDFEHHKKAAEKIPGYSSANKATQGALIDLTFNMGAAWYKKWPNFIKALVAGNMQQAAEELQGSKWYQQVKGRAANIVALIKSGGSSPTAVADAKPMSEKPPSTSASPAPGGESSAGGGGGSLASVAKVQSGVDISGFKSDFEKRVASMAAAFKEKTGKSLLITSGYRSNEKQKELYDQALAANGGNEALTRKKVAQPMPPLGKGKGSFHIKGLAIDINSKGEAGLNALAGSRDAPTGWLEKFGLTRPVPGEDWHVQATGLAPTADNPENPGAPILVAGKDGKAVDVESGNKENIPSASPAAASGGSGSAISSASTDVAAGQRQQAKPTTPVIINAPSNNTNVVTKTEQKSAPKENTDMGKQVLAWA
jgi:lysozyme